MQRVQMTWYRMKKRDDVNIAMKNPQFEELMTSYATVNVHRVTRRQYICRKSSDLLFTDHVGTIQNYI